MKSMRSLLVMVLLGVVIGILGSSFRLALDLMMHLFDALIQHQTSFLAKILVSMSTTCVLVFFSWKTVTYFAPEAAGSGVQEVERTLIHHVPIRWWRVIPVKFFGGLFSLGAQLLLGREGPTIQLGASAGAMISDLFGLSDKAGRRLIGAGAAAGLATAFNAPLAGIVFIFEELRPEFKLSWAHLQCVTIVSLVAVMVLYLIIGNSPTIHMAVYASPPLISHGVFLVFGGIVSAAGWVFNVSLIKVLDFAQHLTSRARHVYALAGAMLIGLCAAISPYLVTGGYGILEHVLNAPVSIGLLFLALFVRWLLGAMSYSLGVPGGIFAPILVLGSILGLLFFHCFSSLCVSMHIEPGMLAIVGMGGLFAAVVRSPLTAVILIIEMTKNASMVLPLLETAMVASICMNWFGNPPIYSQLLKQRRAS
jgi:CIC family chloride channel protein